MILHIGFSVGHEPIEASIGLLKRATEGTSSFSDIGNKTFYVPSVQQRVSKINMNKFKYMGFSLFEKCGEWQNDSIHY